MSDRTPQVLAVGAGPTGLLLAAELGRRDVPCLLIDALDAPRGWDRATVVHARSVEIFEALGLEDRLLARGVRTRAARLRSDGEVLGELDFGASGSRYGFDLGLSEDVTESVLTDVLEALGGMVARSTRLVGLVAGKDAVTATLERDGARRAVAVPWVVGCDGIGSTVRRAAGIEFAGVDMADWRVFDASTPGWDDDFDVRRTLADPDSAHHEAAAAEIDRSYPPSRAVAGADGADPGPGRRLPETGDVRPADGGSCPLHELTHRPGHTLLVLGGPRAGPGRVLDLVRELERRSSPVVDAVVGLSLRPGDRRLGRLEATVAGELGVEGVTVLGVRPDRYIGLRDDRGDPTVVQAYLDGLVA